MNHDFAHCEDYNEKKCPKKCFRGQLVRDLVNYELPVTFMSFKDTDECPLKKRRKNDKM